MSYYAASKNRYYKTFCTKSYFLRFFETKYAIYMLLSSKSARNPGHYRLSTETRPGQMQKFRDTWQLCNPGTLSAFCVNQDTTGTNAKFRDCPGHSGTLGNYAFHSGLGSEGPLSIIDWWAHWARICIIIDWLTC